MAQQLNNEGFDTGSNYAFGDKLIQPSFPRSRFDLSHTVHRDVIGEGIVFPISVMEALPNSDYEISVQHLMRALPQVVPLLTRQRLYLYAFYSRSSDLWSGFQTFVRKGNSGNVVKTVPTINSFNSNATGLSMSNPEMPSTPVVVPGSLSDYFGLLPVGFTGTPDTLGIQCMPFMMYTRIWRDYFLNRNFFWCDDPNDSQFSAKNLAILPEDDSHFRLTDSGQIQSMVDNGIDTYFDVCGYFTYGVDGAGTSADPYVLVKSDGMTFKSRSTTPSGFNSDVFIVSPFYHDYPADYFTSALPWAQRGNTPTIDMSATATASLPALDIDSDLTKVAWSGLTFSRFSSDTAWTNSRIANSDNRSPFWFRDPGSEAGYTGEAAWPIFDNWISDTTKQTVSGKTVAQDISLAVSSGSISVEQLRELSISQTILEKMARTDGSYREFGLTFFGEISKSAVDYRPTFIGGSYSPIIYSEVIQQSETTSTSPLGAYAGHGFSSSAQSGNNGYLGRFHSDDYGFIMILGCVMPDVEYSQGLSKMWTRVNQEEYFLPERSMLGMQPITNKELYVQASTVVDTDGQPVNNGLWAWQDIFDEFRYRENRIGGKLSDKSNESFYPWTQSRYFSSLPNWGADFARASDVRRTQLAATNESEFVATFDISCRAVLPLPYQARPASIINGQVG